MLRETARDLGGDLVDFACAVEERVVAILAEVKPDRPHYVNVEFYAGVAMALCGIPRAMFTATFAVSRVVGWAANVLEQAAERRIIRPAARYVGHALRSPYRYPDKENQTDLTRWCWCKTSVQRLRFPRPVCLCSQSEVGMAVGETVSSNVEPLEIHERKPLMSGGNILLMNLGFFGVQFSFGLTQSAVNPLFTLIGADPEQLPILNIAGPITGLIIQPLIGAISDKTWSDRWGRRKPFIWVARSCAPSCCSCSRS